ncbi:hypothetical protein HAX54_026165 [Datura stramonium]|uniref:Uncharacterized protein n=1 Tax=Datura stramonium TaxID=4076 RepID=A0ABS8S7C8_DATST|nr:hypothetical protein [Datura stramonium]
MCQSPIRWMLSKTIVASDKYKCSDEIISIAAMLSTNAAAGDSLYELTGNGKITRLDCGEYPTLGGHGLDFVMEPTKGLPAHYIRLLNNKNNGDITNHVVICCRRYC